MPIGPLRVKQSTSTTGTGTLVLNAASGAARSFLTQYGSSARKLRYVISGSTIFEIGIGTFDGGSPGTLTRDSVLASSASNALVSLPGGTFDVFPVIDAADRTALEINTSATIGLADLGGVVGFSGSSAATVTLPAVAGVPIGAAIVIANVGTGTLTVAAAGSDTIGGLATLGLAGASAASVALYNGDRLELTRMSSAWIPTMAGGAMVQAGGLVGRGFDLAPASLSGSTCDLSAGRWFYRTVTGALTWTFSNAPAGRAAGFVLELTNGGTGTQTWPTGTKWPSGTAPSLMSSGTDVLVFMSRDGGTTWRGLHSQRDSR